MHFELGAAYFETDKICTSHVKAMRKPPSSILMTMLLTYNVAVCLQRLALFRDAAQWFEETIRRNPNRKDKPELLKRIAALRQ